MPRVSRLHAGIQWKLMIWRIVCFQSSHHALGYFCDARCGHGISEKPRRTETYTLYVLWLGECSFLVRLFTWK
ncbi:hypothetical protein BJX62DRAFT_194213 [Aspergillus germanicus]